MSRINQSIIDRFNSKVKKIESGCWIFIGCKNPKGYGVFQANGTIFSHRFAWIVKNGAIPKGLLVCHTCDNPPCVNPDHLWLGTPKQNTQDMVKKDRPRGAKNPRKGEQNGMSVISYIQAMDIARLIELGHRSTDISRNLNISIHIVNDIRSRKSWKFLAFDVPKKIILIKMCLICLKEFRVMPYQIDLSKFCSHKCYSYSLTREYKNKGIYE